MRQGNEESDTPFEMLLFLLFFFIKSIFWNTCIAERLFQQSLGIKSHGFVRLLRHYQHPNHFFRRNIIFLNINATISFILIFIVDI